MAEIFFGIVLRQNKGKIIFCLVKNFRPIVETRFFEIVKLTWAPMGKILWTSLSLTPLDLSKICYYESLTCMNTPTRFLIGSNG